MALKIYGLQSEVDSFPTRVYRLIRLPGKL
jgi:hypothetical protein